MIVWKAIKPSRLKQDAFRLAALNAMRKVGTQIERDFEKTTATWKHDVEFDRAISLSQKDGGPTLVVDTGDKIYKFVSGGTRVRYATMTPDFVAKTTPRVIGSGPGAGGLAFVNKQRPRPGIKARQFHETIANKWRAPFKRAMEAAMREGRAKCGHAI